MAKCAFGKHAYGKVFHDDFLDRWIKMCRHCNKTTEVESPKDEHGKPIDPHVWLRRENEISEAELCKLLTKHIK